MDPEPDLVALDQALLRTAGRHVPPQLDPARLRRRRMRLEVGPVLWLLCVLGLVVAAACDRPWWFAAALALVLLPGAIARLVARHRELTALAGPGELDAYERDYFAAQANEQRSHVVIEAALAVVFAIVALQTGEAWRWAVPAAFGALAIGRAATVLPFVERANHDAGGARPRGFLMQLLLLGLFVLLPLLLVAGAVRSVWRGLRGRTGGRR